MITSIDRALTRDQVETIRVELRSRGFDIKGDAGDFDAGRVSGVFMYDGETLRVSVTKYVGLQADDVAQQLAAGIDSVTAVVVPEEMVLVAPEEESVTVVPVHKSLKKK